MRCHDDRVDRVLDSLSWPLAELCDLFPASGICKACMDGFFESYLIILLRPPIPPLSLAPCRLSRTLAHPVIGVLSSASCPPALPPPQTLGEPFSESA
jgi:hypothetical protein